VKTIMLAIMVAVLPTIARADEWKPLPDERYRNSFWINPSSIQRGMMAGTTATIPTIGIWMKVENAPLFQVWVDCAGRRSSTYTVPTSPLSGGWTAWAPIPPETMEWAVWQYLCHAKKASATP
jgi:hypothetical protein